MWNRFNFTYTNLSSLLSKRVYFTNCTHIIELPENASHVGQFGLHLHSEGADHVSSELLSANRSFLETTKSE